MNMEEFALGDSIIHKMDPRSKLLTAFAFSVVVALTGDPMALYLAPVFPLVLLGLAGVNFRGVLRRLVTANVFIAFLWIFLPFSHGETVVYSLGPLHVYREGLWFALFITLKSNAIILMIIALLGTSSVFSVVHALSHLHVPDKLVHVFFFCFRYLETIQDEYQRLVTAMKIRGFKPGPNMRTYRAYANLMGILLVRSFERSARIVAAMKCRGFRNKFYILHHYEMQTRDFALCASSVAFLATLMVV